MRNLLTFALVIACAYGSTRIANAQAWLKGLPITDITGQIGSAVAWLAGQYNNHQQSVKENSVGQLVIDLSNLAGSENALAAQIDALLSDPGSARIYAGAASPVLQSLNNNLELVRGQFMQVNNDLIGLDPKWAQTHATLGIDIGSFAHDGALFYCINNCGANFYTGQPAFRLTDQAQTQQLSNVLHSDVSAIRKLAQDIQAAASSATSSK